MAGRYNTIDVPPAREGESFIGEFPSVVEDASTEPSWVALSELAGDSEAIRSARGAAMAGAFVRTMRVTAGLSQEGLAAASGMKQSVISDIERGVGKIGPSLETLLRLAEACGMEIGFARANEAAVAASGAVAAGAAEHVMRAALDRAACTFSAAAAASPGADGDVAAAEQAVEVFRINALVVDPWLDCPIEPSEDAVVVGKVLLGRTEVEVSAKGLLRVQEHDGRGAVYAPISLRVPGSK